MPLICAIFAAEFTKIIIATYEEIINIYHNSLANDTLSKCPRTASDAG